jgi:hypothetical protein
LIEAILSLAVTAIFSGVALGELRARRLPPASKTPDSADPPMPVMVLLGACILLGNAAVWMPRIFGS